MIKIPLNSQIQNGESASHKHMDFKVRQGKTDFQKTDIKKVAKDMEALFLYELIKVMKQTSENMSIENKGLGSDTYMDLFDMEVSRSMAEKGTGISESIENWFKRVPRSDNDIIKDDLKAIKEIIGNADNTNKRCKKI